MEYALKEYAKSFEKLKRQYRRLQGKYHSQKGYFAEKDIACSDDERWIG